MPTVAPVARHTSQDARTSDPAPLRLVTVEVDGGLDGVLRVATLLRGRAYDVRHLSVAIDPGSADGSRVRCAVALPEGAGYTLLERLRRLPSVLSAELAEPGTVFGAEGEDRT
jgi:hypothetical protein